jgi:hypothetical protein
MHFAGNDHFLAFCKIFQGASENFFTRSYRIDIGRIEEIDSQLKRFFDNWTAVFFVQHPFVNPTRRIAEPHTAEADA